MSENDMRAAFEDWYSQGGKWPRACERMGGDYLYSAAQTAWNAFKASAEAAAKLEDKCSN